MAPDFRARGRERIELTDLPTYAREVRESHVATFTRACIATGLSTLDRNIKFAQHASRVWPRDRNVVEVIRAATSPASIGSSAAVAPVTAAFLPALVPLSAGADLLQRGLGLQFDGYAQINVPSIALPVCDFVAELAPIPVQQGSTDRVRR